jgi:hypothetical protein
MRIRCAGSESLTQLIAVLQWVDKAAASPQLEVSWVGRGEACPAVAVPLLEQDPLLDR